ncbi:DUF2842 domain-containing protein [Pyruvatibacter sp.]|uniref:DUF2842 domain-containing protein n=1 Tax=Pyruvatibacter sp. TaxID=1981328 RepID=UPI0032EE1BF4
MTFGIPMRIRKLIGLVVLLAFMFFYALLVMTIAVYRLPEHMGAEIAYYLTAGILWAIPARYLIAWMQIPDEDDA